MKRSAQLSLIAAAGLIAFAPISHAQFTTIINAPPDVPPAAIESNTQLNLYDGGALPPSFRAGASDGSSANVEFNVFGGSVGADFVAHAGTTVNVSGGTFQNWLAERGATFNITGGDLGSAGVEGAVAIRGGTFAPRFVASRDSRVEIFGGEFRLNGVPIEGLELPGSSIPLEFTSRSTLSGTLADGTPFTFSRTMLDLFVSGTLTLTAAELPTVGPTRILASAGPVPLGIRAGQTLEVDAGGVVPKNFNVGRGGTILVQPGGTVGQNLKITAATASVRGGAVADVKIFDGGTLEVIGGSVGTLAAEGASRVDITDGTLGRVSSAGGSFVTVRGGTLPSGLRASNGGSIEVTGGIIGDNAISADGGFVKISGGRIGSNFDAHTGGVTLITGGVIGSRFRVDPGSDTTFAGGSFADQLRNNAGAALRIRGNEFRINGAPVSDSDAIGDSRPVSVPAGGVLSGVFEDGTPFAFSSSVGEDVYPSTSSDNSFSNVTLVSAALPPGGPALINLPASPAPAGIRAGQTLHVRGGGQLPENFNAGWGSMLQIHADGVAARNLEATGAAIDLFGGSIGDDFDAFAGSVVNIFAGNVGANFAAHAGSVVNLRGGAFGQSLRATAGSTLHLFASEFLLDGQPMEGLMPGQPFLLSARTGVLSGRFADHTNFSFPFQLIGRNTQQLISTEAIVTLTLVPEPHALPLVLTALMLLISAARLRP